MKVILRCEFFTLFVEHDERVEPSHQVIGVYPASEEAVIMLSALTGAKEFSTFSTITIDGKVQCLIAPHDAAADDSMIKLVNVITAIRLSSPLMVQLPIFDQPGG